MKIVSVIAYFTLTFYVTQWGMRFANNLTVEVISSFLSSDLEEKWNDKEGLCAIQQGVIYAGLGFPIMINQEFEVDLFQYYPPELVVSIIAYTVLHPYVFILYLKYKS